MKSLSQVWLIVLVAGVAICSSGCLALYTFKSQPVRVLDAETNKPIAGASVSSDYLGFCILNPPPRFTRKTNSKGEVRLIVADIHWGGLCGPFLSACADGYLPSGPGPGSGTCYGSPHGEVFHLYREPGPSITIVVPNGYRGPLKIRFEPIDTLIQGKPGQRDFKFSATAHGDVHIQATPLLTFHISTLTIKAMYADGTIIQPEYFDCASCCKCLSCKELVSIVSL